MHCRNCGNEVAEQAIICVACGVPPRNGVKFCQNCGGGTDPLAEFCVKCGVRVATPAAAAADPNAKSKLAAALLGIFLGGLGIHRFYLGYNGIAIAQLALGLGGILTCGITSIASAIWGLVEGIMILTGSINKDAAGKPLRD
ncbi:MAG: TM2 domain-containing protein [Acidobacteria bacterium]|nr:TM2 domain-containing protein [Acidobacteriota bacterium]MBI3469822.1 TM2 domain-containing protein [Candidatus Solibacter usitatus]